MNRPAQWSVSAQLRLLVVTMLCIVPVVAGAALVTMHSNAREAARVSQVLSPAIDATTAVRLHMTDAEAAWGRTLAGDVDESAAMRSALSSVERRLSEQQQTLDSPALTAGERANYRTLIDRQETAARAWFAWVDRPQADEVQPEVIAGADARFAEFRTLSADLESQLFVQRRDVRAHIAGAFDRLLAIMALLTLFSVVGAYLMWRTIEGSLSEPIVRLRGVVGLQRAGDGLALADGKSGAAEIRALADDFNDLTTTNRALMEEQAQVLHMHELVLDVAQMVRGVDDIEEVLQLVCSHLGTTMSADRVLLYTLGDGEEVVDERVQWHRDDLPPLPPLPPSLAGSVPGVNRELRREGSVFVVRDLLDPEVVRDERAAAFHRATGARSLVMVPVGVGERGLGVLALMTVDIYRRWRRYEIQAVQQCAGYLAQAIVQQRLNEMQEEQVRRLTELDRQKTDFMATVSHELRTPLTSISGYLELLEDGDYGDLEPAQQAALRVIERNSARLRGLIEDLLVLNKIEASGLESDPEDVLVSDMVRAVTEMLQPVADPWLGQPGRRRGGPLPGGARRPDPARTGPDQPRFQRREVHPRRWGRLHHDPCRGPHRRDRRRRHRHRDPGEGPVQAVRPVLPGVQRQRAGDPRHRARPGHRPGHRPGSPRHPHVRVGGGGGDDHDHRPPAAGQPPFPACHGRAVVRPRGTPVAPGAGE